MAIPSIADFLFGEQLSSSDMNAILDDLGTLYNGGVLDASITPAKLTSNARWYEGLGVTTLGSAADAISVSVSGKKFMRCFYELINSGSISNFIRFNGDTATNYNYRYNANDAAATTASGSAAIETTSAGSVRIVGYFDVLNVASREKTVIGHQMNMASGAGVPNRQQYVGKWSNTSDAVSSISINNGSTGDFATGSQLVVIGHD